MTARRDGTRSRSSARRDAVRAMLARSEGFRSAQDIYADLRAGGSKIGLTTVYRALQAMSEAGQVDVLRTADGEAVYRACRTDEHHHHLVCRRCGHTVEVAGPAVERWAEAIGAQYGFTDITHTVEVFGTCGDCAGTADKKDEERTDEKAD
ncbi:MULTISPECIES: Fur family transcriptional regulator [Thermomonospora]|uniref:Ferric uptake regulator, Fur family n=1 Tax=Thermomonospora curvata (strain ATCC 19995 / DSM 43183 / JCM 3096 / KCTC 9072 / NBRC 15933 / NCIMB 10081 / Henssen B9) TaxID=471852 RepID=D1A9T3_THECD|nr:MULTISPECIES: transcriptional repressor [Thermomonospora]ACY98769.1 ferric uptake regulator, Fur family [Thermomonospora curvata DSM 43183]PKK12982.1 MAG: transcriptional repressor [Thermomonospora sp. CIF 1]